MKLLVLNGISISCKNNHFYGKFDSLTILYFAAAAAAAKPLQLCPILCDP